MQLRAFLTAALISAASLAGAAAAPSRVPPNSVGFSAERLVQLRDFVKHLVDSGSVPGAVIAMSRHGKLVLFESYGQADADHGTPMKNDSLFRVYSQTKVVTGVAMMLLFEQGKWKFDDPVTKYIPEFKQLRVFDGLNPDGSMKLVELKRSPTMRELVTHSAGFGYGLSDDNPVDKAYSQSGFMTAASATDAIQRIAQLPLASQPGLHWRYSAAADIQGYIVERISGESLADFMQDHVFGPLKMHDTAFYVPAAKRERLVTLKSYDAATHKLTDPSGVLVFDYSRPPATASGGAGLVSTAGDYLRFARMLLNGGELEGTRVLSPAAVKLLASNQLAEDIRATPGESFSARSGVGFGVDVSVLLDTAKAGSLRGVGTYDWGGAAGTWFWIDPANDVVFVGMIQVMNRWVDSALQSIDSDSSALVYRALVDPAK